MSLRRNAYALGLAGMGLAVLTLSTGSTIVKAAHTPGTVMAFWRLWFSTLIWQVILVANRTPIRRSTLKLAWPAGALFGVNLVCFFTAVGLTRVANAEFIGTLAPVFLVPFAAIRLHEKVRREVMVAGAVALVGVAIVLFFAPVQKGANNWKGNAIALVAVGTWCTYLVLSRHARRQLSTVQFMGGMNLVAAIVITPYVVARGGLLDVSAKGWALIALMTFSNGLLAHGLVAWSQSRVPLSTMSLMQLAQPGLSVVWAYLVVGEGIRPVQLVGMALVLAAVGAIAREASRRPVTMAEPVRASEPAAVTVPTTSIDGELGGTPG